MYSYVLQAISSSSTSAPLTLGTHRIAFALRRTRAHAHLVLFVPARVVLALGPRVLPHINAEPNVFGL